MRRKQLLLLYCILIGTVMCMGAVTFGILFPKESRKEQLQIKVKEESIQKNSNKKETPITLEDIIKNEIPLFYQWEEPWGDKVYGSGKMAETGCGPTCLSMVSMYLLNDVSLTPEWMADFSIQNGYCVAGSGSSWLLMSEGAEKLGLLSFELIPVKQTVETHLLEGNPVICIMGPGDFTDEGHFIVLTEMEEGKIRIHDPYSVENSSRLWEFEEIEDQIRNLWAFRKMCG